MTHLFRTALIAAFLALAPVGSLRGDSLSAEDQRKRDESDCRRWATLHTGFDPKNPPPSSDAPPSDQTVAQLGPSPGAANSALAIALRDAERRRNASMARKKAAQYEVDLESQRAVYERTVKTCLEGRGHSVADHASH